ncbi:PAS domain S-box protein, partial [Vibrio alginolyticus]
REASLSHYYDLQPVMMLTLDEQNRIQQVNRFAEQMLGFDASQMLGHRLKEFYLSEQALSARQMLLQPNQSLQGVWQREIEYRHADGHAIWVRENIRALVETGHLLIVGEDVTPTRKLADELAYQAKFDLLTNTYNRNQFELELAQALQETETEL